MTDAERIAELELELKIAHNCVADLTVQVLLAMHLGRELAEHYERNCYDEGSGALQRARHKG